MSESLQISEINPIHPFPARMAPSIVWNSLPRNGKSIRILDPMVGSGTSLVISRARGHQAVGCDTDPLAILMSRAWCSDISSPRINELGRSVLSQARIIAKNITLENSYPFASDESTKKFINFWFDETNRTQLTALSLCISQMKDPNESAILWAAFSRLIITKKIGVSLAMDVSHSRPHRKYEKAPIQPFEKFIASLEYITKKLPFRDNEKKVPSAFVTRGDARSMPFTDHEFDLVITSPPYLNAIDYLRGNKLSLVWMGYSINSIKTIRSQNIGTDQSLSQYKGIDCSDILSRMGKIGDLDLRYRKMIIHYINDMNNVITECRRVLKDDGQAIFVIGNSSIRGIYLNNSEALIGMAERNGFKLSSKEARQLPESRRYLPPPSSKRAGENLQGRMREEVILNFKCL
jgi:DNA modification methylase